MRLQVMAAFAAVLLWSGAAEPQGRAGSWVSVYTSSDHLTVVSPQLSVRAPVRDFMEIDAAVDADIITSASVDVMTAASPRGYEEVRHGYSLGTTLRGASGATAGFHYIPSFEPDYESQGIAVNASREWLDRRLTTEIGARLSFDSVGRRDAGHSVWRPLLSGGVMVGVALAVSPKMVAQVAYEIEINDGFMASPYRYVPIYVEGQKSPIRAPEQVPDNRIRHALAGGLRRAFGGGWFGAGTLRLYVDSWGIASHTEELEVQRSLFRDRVIVGFAARAYGQSSATFHRYRYEAEAFSIPKLRSADKMLSSSWSLLFGPRVEVAVGPFGPIEELRATAKVELYDQHFFEFAPLRERQAAIVSFGIAGELSP